MSDDRRPTLKPPRRVHTDASMRTSVPTYTRARTDTEAAPSTEHWQLRAVSRLASRVSFPPQAVLPPSVVLPTLLRTTHESRASTDGGRGRESSQSSFRSLWVTNKRLCIFLSLCHVALSTKAVKKFNLHTTRSYLYIKRSSPSLSFSCHSS